MELTLRAYVKYVQFGYPAELSLGEQRNEQKYMNWYNTLFSLKVTLL